MKKEQVRRSSFHERKLRLINPCVRVEEHARLVSVRIKSRKPPLQREIFFGDSAELTKANWLYSTYLDRMPIRRLEVERKFLVRPVTVSYLRSNSKG